jgi:hypothetical protein
VRERENKARRIFKLPIRKAEKETNYIARISGAYIKLLESIHVLTLCNNIIEFL